MSDVDVHVFKIIHHILPVASVIHEVQLLLLLLPLWRMNLDA